MVKSTPTVLITGCSDGSLGSVLSLQFHKSGYRVFATARNTAKLSACKSAGIETLSLDVLSSESIKECVAEVKALTGGTLDILVNNAGQGISGPLSDFDMATSKALFDINVWACLEMTQAFLPLLLRSSHPGGPIIVNHTSAASVITPPFSGIYGASKAALATLSIVLRAELRPFGVRVVDLKTGATESTIAVNQLSVGAHTPKNSIYYPAREFLDKILSGEVLGAGATDQRVWARKVVAEIGKSNPPREVWVGSWAFTTWLATWMPTWMAHGIARGAVKFERVEKDIESYGREKAVKHAFGEE